MLKKLTSLLFSRHGNDLKGFKSAISTEEYPLIYRELSNLSSERLAMGSSVRYPSLESALNRHLSNQEDKEGSNEVYELNDKTALTDEEFSMTHADYIGKILRLFDIHPEEELYSDHDYLSDHLAYDIEMHQNNQQNDVKVHSDMPGNSSKDIAPQQGNANLWNGDTDAVTKPFIIPPTTTTTSSKVTLFPPQSFNGNTMKTVQTPAGSKRYLILKNGNQVAGFFPPGTVLYVPPPGTGSGIDQQGIQQGIGLLPGQLSAHKYFTRSADNSRKRPSSESSNGSSSGTVKKSKPLMGSKSPGTSDNIVNSPVGRCLSPAYSYNFIANKSPLREISQSDNRLNGQSIDKQDKEEFAIEQSPRRDMVYDQISESFVLAVNMTEGGNGFVEKQVPKSELVKG